MSENIEGALPVRMREAIAGLPRYKQGKAPREGGFKLSSNENPFEPLPGVIEAVLPALAQLNRYPDAQANELRDVLAARHGITREQIHVTPGSVAALQQVVAAATGPGDEVVYPWRSFEAYPWLVLLAGATGVQVPNLPDHSHDLDGIKAAITPATRVVILCTPNNPTGTIVTLDQFRDFMASVPTDLLVILDEAYFEFNSGDGSFDGTALLGEYPNLVVLRTFSKAYGLAGLRIGYAMGREDVMDVVRNAATPLALTDIAAKAALASLAREDELLERVRHIARIRHELWEALIAQGWDVPEPHGNFLWLTTGAETAQIAATLEDAGIVVRAFPPEGLRISIGEYEAVGTLLTLTAEIVTNLPVGHPARR